MKWVLFILGAVLVLAQTTINAGSSGAGSGDQGYSPATACIFAGATATNPPCVVAYSDLTMGPPTTLRYGYAGLPFSYLVPAPNGTCDVALTFVEPNKMGVGQRVFTVVVQGVPSAPIDIFSHMGLKKPYTVPFPSVPVTNGTVSVAFQPIIGNAVVSTLAVANCKAPTPPTPPLSFNCVLPLTCTLDPVMNTYTVTVAVTGPCGGIALCAYVDHEVPSGAINGTNTVFNLLAVPATGSEYVYLNGILMKPGVDYMMVGKTITLVTAPTPNAILQVNYRA